MTIANAVNRNTYPGTGSVGPFAYNFMVFAASDLRVIKRSATDIETVLAYPAAYSVTGIGFAVGGSITLTVALAVGETLTIRRVRPITQETDLRGQGSFLPETYEDALDHLIMVDQQHQDELNRRFGIDETEALTYDLLIPIGALGQVIGWGASGLTNLTVASTGAVALPGEGRTVTSLSNYLANNAVYQVLDYAPVGVVINTGVNDAYASIVAADTAANVTGGVVDFAIGTFKTTANLVQNAHWRGIRWGSIIRPQAGVTKCVDNKSWDITGIELDGTDTTGACTGLDVGTTSLISNCIFRDMSIHHFLGVGARGIKLAQVVTARFENVYVYLNYMAMHVHGGNTPTQSSFANCAFRTSTTKAIHIQSCYSLSFHDCLWESNGEEAIYVQNVGDNAIEILLDGSCWFEDNWNSIALGAGRHAQYDLVVDGAVGPAGTIRIKIRDAFFNEDAVSSARAMRLTNAIAYEVHSVNVPNAAGQIKVDGTSYGRFTSWPEQNGPFKTTVDAIAGSAWNTRDHVEDIEGAWITYAPTYGGTGAMTFTSVTTTKARYRVVGKTMEVMLYFVGTTGGAANLGITATLPSSYGSKDGNMYLTCLSTQDGATTVDVAAAHPMTGAPGTVEFYVKAFAVWGLGAGRGVLASLTFELA